ncbi:MAG: tryptophan--tRNA ligase [Oscillospiraceae bacterium]|nr:tryptophan--tRNA ligase [Oscillospiraceae bacterium]MDE6776770.1 tryptophan--tRNA ligase [Oscillospiraceae bacterium]MDE7093751.1 tryptophan--tRNA ligase [Oscillospiraceae bacterium]
MSEQKKLIFSGIQPTGTFTLGNYIGAIRNWKPLQDEYRCIYCVVDEHALTVKIDPAKLRQKTLEAYAQLLACGIDLEKSLLFIQSHVPTHAQLSWVLNCSTQFGELSRMTQFKDKSQKHPDDVNAGLFDYPVLMAADILVYNADLVPVGADQMQHLELARTIARRFNGRYGDVFTVPEGYISPIGAKVMSLQEPTKKMSKSDENPNAVILILDDKDTIIRKCKRAVTDSETEIIFREGKDGINNLLTIYSAVTGISIDDAVKEFDGQGYGKFKLAVGEAVADHLAPVREEYARLIADKAYLKECYTRCGIEALRYSQRVLNKVYRKIGFVASEIR